MITLEQIQKVLAAGGTVVWGQSGKIIRSVSDIPEELTADDPLPAPDIGDEPEVDQPEIDCINPADIGDTQTDLAEIFRRALT